MTHLFLVNSQNNRLVNPLQHGFAFTSNGHSSTSISFVQLSLTCFILLFTIKNKLFNCYNCHLENGMPIVVFEQYNYNDAAARRRLLLRALITTTTTTLSAINLFFRLLFAYSQLRVEISYLLQHASRIHCYYIFQSLITCNRGDTTSGTYGADQIYSRSGRIPQRVTS